MLLKNLAHCCQKGGADILHVPFELFLSRTDCSCEAFPVDSSLPVNSAGLISLFLPQSLTVRDAAVTSQTLVSVS